MIKRLLVICHDFHPMPSANTLCLDPILSELVARGVTIDLICVRPSLRVARRERYRDVNVYRLLSISDLLHRWLGRMASIESRPIAILGSVLLLAFRMLLGGFIEGYVSLWRRKAERICAKLHGMYSYDAMVSVSLPFVTNQVAFNLKQRSPGLPWLVYELDPFTYNYVLPTRQVGRRIAIETAVARAADITISTSGIIEENVRRRFRASDAYRQMSLPLPNLAPRASAASRRPDSDASCDRSTINVVYTGVFYQRIRPPEALGRLMTGLRTDDVVFHLYGGSCENFFRDLDLPRGRVVLHGRVSKEVSDQAIDFADVVLNVGNDLPNQIPSKLFAYMASGKPILHLSQNADDPSLPLLNTYGHVLIVDATGSPTDSEFDRIASFLEAVRGVTLAPEEIERRMDEYLSERVVRRFIASLEGVVRNRPRAHD